MWGRSSTSSSSSARSSTSSNFSRKASQKIRLADIQEATDNFSPAKIIHTGKYGITYEGTLNGEMVAVKRLDKTANIVDEFRKEAEILAKFPSPYLVGLRGKCEESKEMILVYEFMRNGTLAENLYKEDGTGASLSWAHRLRICIDVAKGLDYLHNGCAGAKRIIHGNIKPDNILLDDYFAAKIAEFGYAKMGPAFTNNSAVNATQMETDVYLDPHYNLTGQVTRRTDIYSFGVVLLEVLCGRGNLVQLVKKRYGNGPLDAFIDKHLKGNISQDCLKEFADVAYRCVDEKPINRPKLSDVVEKLESLLKKAGA